MMANKMSHDSTPHAIEIANILKQKYHDFDHYNQQNPLDELIFIICSSKTDEDKYLSTFRALKREFPRFALLEHASQDKIAEVLAPGGLSNQKAEGIKRIVTAIQRRFGKVTLAPLKNMSDEECELFLTSLPRVGKKTARCVMMYSLKRKVFPVDTHCWRIAQRLGWIDATYSDGRCSQKDMDRLQERIDPSLRFSLHVNFVSLGREICTPRNPRCEACPIERYCPKIGLGSPTIDKLEGSPSGFFQPDQ